MMLGLWCDVGCVLSDNCFLAKLFKVAFLSFTFNCCITAEIMCLRQFFVFMRMLQHHHSWNRIKLVRTSANKMVLRPRHGSNVSSCPLLAMSKGTFTLSAIHRVWVKTYDFAHKSLMCKQTNRHSAMSGCSDKLDAVYSIKMHSLT